jgi:hypothetical protein
MARRRKQSTSSQVFRTVDAFLRHCYPAQQSRHEGERDISATAQQLAASTVRTVRKQLGKQ